MAIDAIAPAILAAFADIVEPQHVLTDPEVTAGYAVDWTGRFKGATPAVVRPGTTEEVSAVVALCREAGLAVVPQGGNTGLAGGSVPLDGEVVLSLSRLDRTAVDGLMGQATAGAGTTIAALQAASDDAGWAYGVDFAARDSATVGGSVATNAGGLRMLRYGDTRAQVVGVEAVLADGRVISHLGGLLKDNTGYHLPSLLCGSEGTLGIVTAARLRLVPPVPERVVALLAFAGAPDVVAATAALRHGLGSLEAAEVFFGSGVELVMAALGLPPPPGSATGTAGARIHGAYLLVECAASHDPTAELAAAVDGLTGVIDVAVANDARQRAQLWRYREAHTEAINTLGPPHKLDVTLPLPALADFVAEVQATVSDATDGRGRCWLFGHAADGNLHVNVTGVAPDDERVDEAVLLLVGRLDGSISAEHGIGTAKKRWLHLNRSEAEIDAFRAIKRALDPEGILNPNVLLP